MSGIRFFNAQRKVTGASSQSGVEEEKRADLLMEVVSQRSRDQGYLKQFNALHKRRQIFTERVRRARRGVVSGIGVMKACGSKIYEDTQLLLA